MKRSKPGLLRDYRAILALLSPRSRLTARRRAVKSRREAWT